MIGKPLRTNEHSWSLLKMSFPDVEIDLFLISNCSYYSVIDEEASVLVDNSISFKSLSSSI